MLRIVCDPSSGSIELYLTEITRSALQIFVVYLVGVWQRNFEPVVCVYGTTGWELVVVCVYGTTGWELVVVCVYGTTGWELVVVCVCTVRRAGN